MAFKARYDEEKEIYRDCRWCSGRGCLQCKAECDKEYQRQFPNGPEPILTASLDEPESIQRLNDFLAKLTPTNGVK